ncbi:MAG TPA: hypothetical protein VF670_09530, partial [Duganella sp.]
MAEFAPAQRAFSWRSAFAIEHINPRLNTAFVVSVLVHVLLLSIAVGGDTFGMPGLHFPWEERRLGANELRV